jgi:hypothetical protein
MIVESSSVAYAGDDPFQDVGSIGKVVALAGSGAHVMWQSGPKVNMVELVDMNDLVEHRGGKQAAQAQMRAQAFTDTAFADSLDIVALPSLQVRATYDEEGEDGLLTALSEAGRLAVLAEYAEEALGLVAGRIRNDPEFSVVLAQLEPDEAATLLSRVSSLVLRDLVSEDD